VINIVGGIFAGLIAIVLYRSLTRAAEDKARLFGRRRQYSVKPADSRFYRRSAPAPDSLAKQKWVALWVLVALQIGDLVSTHLALSAHGVVELNPLVREMGLWPAKLLATALIAALVWRVRSLSRVWGVCAVYSLLVISNVRMWGSH
jgi:hypothetical protein